MSGTRRGSQHSIVSSSIVRINSNQSSSSSQEIKNYTVVERLLQSVEHTLSSVKSRGSYTMMTLLIWPPSHTDTHISHPLITIPLFINFDISRYQKLYDTMHLTCSNSERITMHLSCYSRSIDTSKYFVQLLSTPAIIFGSTTLLSLVKD